jgi:hypothetical protein
MLKVASCAAVALLTAGAANAQDTAIWNDDIDGWAVVVDRTINDSCFIIAGFGNNVYLRFQFNLPQQNIQMIVADAAWDSLETGTEYDLNVAFGDREPWTGLAKGHRWQDVLPSLVLSVPVANHQAADFIDDFTAVNSVRISFDGTEIANLPLKGVDEAVQAMLDCQAAMSEVDHSVLDADPFAGKGGRI